MLVLDALDEARYLALSHLKRFSPIYVAPTNLRRIREGLGIPLRLEPMPGKYTGSCFTHPGGNRFITVNVLLPHGRLVWTVAHELGHIVLGHLPPRRPWQERIAHIYARELLLPEVRIRRQIRRFGPDPWLLARLNGVSVKAVRRRLRELGAA